MAQADGRKKRLRIRVKGTQVPHVLNSLPAAFPGDLLDVSIEFGIDEAVVEVCSADGEGKKPLSTETMASIKRFAGDNYLMLLHLRDLIKKCAFSAGSPEFYISLPLTHNDCIVARDAFDMILQFTMK